MYVYVLCMYACMYVRTYLRIYIYAYGYIYFLFFPIFQCRVLNTNAVQYLFKFG